MDEKTGEWERMGCGCVVKGDVVVRLCNGAAEHQVLGKALAEDEDRKIMCAGPSPEEELRAAFSALLDQWTGIDFVDNRSRSMFLDELMEAASRTTDDGGGVVPQRLP